MHSFVDSLYPETNQYVAKRIYLLEVGLREFIIEELSRIGGARWHKTHLPADVSQKYLHGLQAERASNWTSHIEHHPLYYVDFPDLTKVLEKNWRLTFQRLLKNKDVFIYSLRSLEPIRNKLAHNRKISEADCKIVDSELGSV